MMHNNGTYVALELSKKSQDLVDDFVTNTLRLPSPINPAYLHTTVIYSPSPVPDAEYLDRCLQARARPLRYEIFKTKTGKNCLTVIVDCTIAQNLNTMLTRLGATTAFHPYTAHLTLSYDYNGTVEELPVIPFDLEYDSLLVRELDPTFVPPSK